MADVVPADNEDSRSSVIEIEPPKKPEPLFIDLADEEVVINVKSSLPYSTSGSNGPSSAQCYNDSKNFKQNGDENNGETEDGENENGNATRTKNEVDEREEEEEEEAEEVEEEEDEQQQEEEEDGDDDDESAAKDGGAEQTENDEDKEIENEEVSEEGSEHKGEPKEIKKEREEEGAEIEGDGQEYDQDYEEGDEDDVKHDRERKPNEGDMESEVGENLDDEKKKDSQGEDNDQEEEGEQYDLDHEGDEAEEGTSKCDQKATSTLNFRQKKTSSKLNKKTSTQSKSTTQSTTLFNYDPVPSNALGTYPPPLTSIETFIPPLTSIETFIPPLTSIDTYPPPLTSLPTYTSPLNSSTSEQQSSFSYSQEFQPSYSQSSESFYNSRFSYNNVKRPKMDDEGPFHPAHWTPEMVKYYDEDWEKEEFNVEKLQSLMDKNPSLWQISSKDLSFWKNKNKKTDPKCYNCLNYGHESYNCMEEKKPPTCHMCGFPGHIAYKCPHSLCLNCGTATTGYVTKCKNCRFGLDKVCERCNLTGHIYSECTDHWRLYHSTIGTKRVIEPKEEIYKPPRNRWCCNCGRRGHLQVDCGYCVKNYEFSDTLPFVTSYVKAFTRGSQLGYGYEDSLETEPLKIDIADNIMTNPSQRHIYHRKTSQLRNRLRAIKRTSDRVERQRNMDRRRHPGGGFNRFSFL